MYLARFTFTSRKPRHDDAAGAVAFFARRLRCNGQILAERPVVTTKTGFDCYVQVPERTSLALRNANPDVRYGLAWLHALGVSRPKVQILGRVAGASPPDRCRAPSSYILFTHFKTEDSPVVCGDCFLSVPLYRLPTEPARKYIFDCSGARIAHWKGPSHDFSTLIAWQEDYGLCDSLYMRSGVGERFGLNQTTALSSSVTKDGRYAAESLEWRLKKRVYYFLNHNSGTSLARELKRRCPSCGGRWRLKEPLFDRFDFRCVRCRLVSNVKWGLREAANK